MKAIHEPEENAAVTTSILYQACCFSNWKLKFHNRIKTGYKNKRPHECS